MGRCFGMVGWVVGLVVVLGGYGLVVVLDWWFGSIVVLGGYGWVVGLVVWLSERGSGLVELVGLLVDFVEWGFLSVDSVFSVRDWVRKEG